MRFEMMDLAKIKRSFLNPRSELNIQRLEELKASIIAHGILEPLIVRPKNGKYEIVCGERRFRVAQELHIKKIPVLKHDYTDDQVRIVMLVENLQREDLSAPEIGRTARDLLGEDYPKKKRKYMDPVIGTEVEITTKWIGDMIGKSRQRVEEYISASKFAGDKAAQLIAPISHKPVKGTGRITTDTAAKIARKIPTLHHEKVAKKVIEKKLDQTAARKFVEKVADKIGDKKEEVAKKQATLANYTQRGRVPQIIQAAEAEPKDSRTVEEIPVEELVSDKFWADRPTTPSPADVLNAEIDIDEVLAEVDQEFAIDQFEQKTYLIQKNIARTVKQDAQAQNTTESAIINRILGTYYKIPVIELE
ncbi:MAG: ParB/RepB/Spo0J family partition protein [Candidatus Heimdallarchaeota archaeon]